MNTSEKGSSKSLKKMYKVRQERNVTEVTWKEKLKQRLSLMMVDPNNKRLIAFHFVVFLIFEFDFFLTGFILANYQLLNGAESEDSFMNHHSSFALIITVQIFDIILNFFKIVEQNTKQIKEPFEVGSMYL